MDNLSLKRCSTCKEHKSLDNFNRDKSRKDGFSWRCKPCHASMNKKYTITAEYREKARIKANIIYHQNKDAINAKQRAKRAANPEPSRAYKKQYRLKNLEKELARGKAYRLANPEKIKENSRINNNRRRGAQIERYTTQQALDLYGTNCHLCGEAIDLSAPRWTAKKGWERGLHLDHVIRISEGGKDCLENVRPSHAICNLQKH